VSELKYPDHKAGHDWSSRIGISLQYHQDSGEETGKDLPNSVVIVRLTSGASHRLEALSVFFFDKIDEEVFQGTHFERDAERGRRFSGSGVHASTRVNLRQDFISGNYSWRYNRWQKLSMQ
jgi:hypothetical protein